MAVKTISLRKPTKQSVSSKKIASSIKTHPSSSLKSLRKIDLELIEDSLSFSQESDIQYKVIDLISIYQSAMEIRAEIPSMRVNACDAFLDEVESCLWYFLSHKVLPVRKISISEILK